MPPRVSPSVEVFLLVEQPRQRLSHWTRALAPLDDATAPPLASVDAYFEPASHLAIFGLRYDTVGFGLDRLKRVTEVARLAELSLIHPGELSEGDRRRFVTDRLERCTLRVLEQRTVVSALVELVRQVRGQKTTTMPPITGGMPAPQPRSRAQSSGRLPSELSDPALVLPARGTRDDQTADPAPVRSSRDLAKGSVRQPLSAPAVSDPEAIVQTEAQGGLSEALTTAVASPARLATALPQRRDDGPRPSPNVVSRSGVHRANTVTMSTVEAARMLEAARAVEAGRAPTPADPLSSTRRTERYDASEPPDGDGDGTRGGDEPGMIHARYLRGGRWVPIRVGALSLRGATLMAGALPRVEDRVDVALSYSGHRAIVRGAVTKVSTRQEAATSGAATFTVTFELDDASRRQLTALLTAARAANVTIKPPPSRSTRRYPVEWPVCLGTERGAVRADALDVSADGMFVKPLHALTLEANLSFSAVLDDGLSPVSGRSRVVRAISDAEASAAGLLPGYGLSILEMAEPDRARWSAFLARIEKRAARRVLIGASPERLAELQNGLIAAGYAVTGGIDAGAIAQLASADARPVDAALIDAAWIASAESASWVESLFSARKVPCVTIHGDAKRARIAIDRLLSVA